MQLNNINGFNRNLLRKYIQLEKNFLLLQFQLQEKKQTNSNYKTELCKKFQTRGYCPYGNKCRFAHGKEELITKIQGANYKKEKCNSFYVKGYCPYGSRCQFQHDERKFKDINISYFYLQLFLFKYFGFLTSKRYYFEKNTSILDKRLSVFESITHDFICEQNINSHTEKEKYILDSDSNEGNSQNSESTKNLGDTFDNNNNNHRFLKEIYININNL